MAETEAAHFLTGLQLLRCVVNQLPARRPAGETLLTEQEKREDQPQETLVHFPQTVPGPRLVSFKNSLRLSFVLLLRVCVCVWPVLSSSLPPSIPMKKKGGEKTL